MHVASRAGQSLSPLGITPPTIGAIQQFSSVTPNFLGGTDSPRAYLERCLEVIAEQEPAVRAWVVVQESAARVAADASSARYAAGQPLSPVDGMPVGIKDLLETKDMPTQMGCDAFAGNFPKRDSALVRALRDAGAVILGKTVTTELGGAHPGPTTNPWDARYTPGGSSSGSAAAIAAGMVPAAIGTQVGGSIIRPASFCGTFALKPTQGAINRGERQGYSQSTAGVLAGSLEDTWLVATEIVRRVGGDPGQPGLYGPVDPPLPLVPRALIAMETSGWPELDDRSRDAFEQFLQRLQARGVRVLRRGDHPAIEAFEQSIASAPGMSASINNFENKPAYENLYEQDAARLSAALVERIVVARKLTLNDYRACLEQRRAAQRYFAELADLAEAVVTPGSHGPASAPANRPSASVPPPTGDAAFNLPASLLFAPAVNVPLLTVDGLPLGVQVMGQMHADASVLAIGRWLQAQLEPISVGG
jgi:Asp-tRNA(Asn)/Glu-tRNA(Gln) amidotransferase A subunit family amidase